MLYIRSSLHIIFYLRLVLILEILRNSRTHGESWGFRYFHIWVFSNFENRIIWFYLFYHQLHIIFIAFWLDPRNSSNSRTHGESWGFRYFHIWVFSNFENGIIWFYLFYLQLFLLSKLAKGFVRCTRRKIYHILF